MLSLAQWLTGTITINDASGMIRFCHSKQTDARHSGNVKCTLSRECTFTRMNTEFLYSVLTYHYCFYLTSLFLVFPPGGSAITD